MNTLNPRYNLRARFGLTLGSLILLLAIVFVVAVEQPAQRQIEADIGNRLAALAVQGAEGIEQEIAEGIQDLQLLASLPQLQDPATPLATQQALLSQIAQSRPAIAGLALVDGRGTVSAGTGLLPPGLDAGGSDWFRQGQRTLYVGQSGEHLLALALPLAGAEGRAGGVLAAYLDWEESQVVDSAPGADIFVLGDDGHLLYGGSAGNPPAALGSTLAAQAGAAGARTGYRSDLWPGDVAYLTGYARLGGPEGAGPLEGWVLVRENQAAALAPVRRLQTQILLWGGGLGLLFLLLGWFLAGPLVRPLTEIAQAADRIRAGDMTAEIPEQRGGGEVATLSRSLRSMVETLHEQKADLARNQALLEQRVQERTRTLTALYQVLEMANAAEDLQTALQQALLPVLEASGGQAAFIHLAQAGDLSLAACQGMTAEEVAAWREQQGTAGGPAAVLTSQDTVFRAGTIGPDGASGSRLPPYIGVPIKSGGRVHGVLSVLGRESQPFVEDTVALLASVADEFGEIVERARLQQRDEQLAVLEERNRLARELHDSVTQSLYSLTLFAEAGRRMLAEGELEAATEFFGDVGQTSQQALKEMRLLLHKLRPAALQKEGLVRALRHRLNAVEERSGIANELQVEGDLELTPAGEEALYHIATEALNNALRHAQAGRVRVTVTGGEGAVELLVSDDGLGFEPALAADSGGMGLANMRERARHAGGELAVESAPGQGTTVRVRLPR